ncbi:MAG: DUF2505 domain-containing protein [Propionibacteriaceae bacterium]|jgi:hypothetical protein|nr:DUF2505 domain-containing protein [Propionibacteriaceae bacterium]
MDLRSTLSFNAPVTTVAAMLIHPDFAKELGRRISALNSESTTGQQSIETRFTVAAPESIRKLVGAEMKLIQSISWTGVIGLDRADGQMSMRVAGMPAESAGAMKLTADGDDKSTLNYQGELHVRIPLLGKKLESMVGGQFDKVMQAFETVGNDWLAKQ